MRWGGNTHTNNGNAYRVALVWKYESSLRLLWHSGTCLWSRCCTEIFSVRHLFWVRCIAERSWNNEGAPDILYYTPTVITTETPNETGDEDWMFACPSSLIILLEPHLSINVIWRSISMLGSLLPHEWYMCTKPTYCTCYWKQSTTNFPMTSTAR